MLNEIKNKKCMIHKMLTFSSHYLPTSVPLATGTDGRNQPWGAAAMGRGRAEQGSGFQQVSHRSCTFPTCGKDVSAESKFS